MKKLLWMGLLLILSVSCCGFSSCHGPQYEEAERDAMEESGFEVIEDEEQKKYARADTAEEEIEEDREETDLRTYDMAYFQETRKRSGMNFQINLYLI